MVSTRVSLTQIEEGETLRELIRLYKENKSSFAQRFNLLRNKTKKAFEKSGYGSKDVNRLISEIRNK